MTAFQIVGALVNVAADTPTTLTLTAATNSITGAKSITFLKVDNADVATASGLTFSLTAAVETVDLANTIVVAPGATAFVQVAPANYTGPVYIRASGGSNGLYVQPVAIVG